MPDGQYSSSFIPAVEEAEPETRYFPPFALLLQGLNISELDFARATAAVDMRFLKFLIGEIARPHPFDAQFYADANPDVEAARLAGDVTSMHEHFVTQGFFEQRQSCEMPFDADYYAASYNDLAEAFDGSDDAALNRHFRQHGWREGRVGVPAQRAEADRWVAAARGETRAGG